MAQRKKKNRRKKYAPGGIRKPRRVGYPTGGMTGADGAMRAAYQAWLAAGNEGTYRQWLSSIGQNAGGRSTPITGSSAKSTYTPRLDEFDPQDFATMTEADRIAELMARGQTEEQARANQQQSLDKGFDINQDGVVTDQELRLQTPPVKLSVEAMLVLTQLNLLLAQGEMLAMTLLKNLVH